MRPTFRKLEVKDIGNLERLVADNIEGVEPGIKVVDSRLVLGQAAIDLVGLDSKGSLVLIALDFSADDGLLLRVMDAYSWCLEYPDTLRRLYPMAQATSRPPRILFIVEKMTDAFMRRVKQLSFLEIDCFEFRNLEVNGASVVYFDLVERIRKAAVESTTEVSATPAPVPAPVVVPTVESRVEPMVAPRIEPRIEPRTELRAEPAKPAVEWPSRAEPRETVSKPQRIDPPKAVIAELVVAEAVHVETAPIVVAEPEPVAPIAAPPSAPAPLEHAVVVAAPVVAEPSVVAEVKVAPVVDHQTVNLVSSAPVVVAAPAIVVPAPTVVTPAPQPIVAKPAEPALALESIETTSRAYTNGHVAAPEPIVAPVVEAPPVAPPIEAPVAVAPAAPAPVAPVAAPAPVVPTEPAPVQATPAWAKPGSQPNGTKPQFFAQAMKTPSPVGAPVLVAAVAAAPAEPATPPAASKVGLEVDDRPELESLSFPKDGLSRQWLEFLSQLGATK